MTESTQFINNPSFRGKSGVVTVSEADGTVRIGCNGSRSYGNDVRIDVRDLPTLIAALQNIHQQLEQIDGLVDADSSLAMFESYCNSISAAADTARLHNLKDEISQDSSLKMCHRIELNEMCDRSISVVAARENRDRPRSIFSV